MNKDFWTSKIQVPGAALGVIVATLPGGGMAELGAILLFVLALLSPGKFHFRIPVALALLLLWITLSYTWSTAPSSTLRECLRLLIVIIGAAAFASKSPLRTILWGLALGSSGTALGCLVAWALDPVNAWHDGLQGYLSHPNGLGYAAAVGVVASTVAPGGWRPRLLTGSISLAALVSSAAMTSILAAGLALFAFASICALRRAGRNARRLIATQVMTAFGLLLGLIVAEPVLLSRAIGRDTTFTGRTVIWPILVDLGSREWLVGHGFGAFWVPGASTRILAEQRVGFPFTSAHNAVLDFYLQTGVIGVTLGAVVLAALAMRMILAIAEDWALRTLPILLLSCIHGMTESTSQIPLAWIQLAFLTIWCTATAHSRFDTRYGSSLRHVRKHEAAKPLAYDSLDPGTQGNIRHACNSTRSHGEK